MKQTNNVSSESLLEKKQMKRMIQQSQEYAALGFAAVLSVALAFLAALAGFDFVSRSVKTGPMLVAGAFAIEAAIVFVVRALVKRDYEKYHDIQRRVRLLGIVLILMVLTCNIFACEAGFLLAKKKKSLEYRIGVYMLLTDIMVMFISSINILKGYVISTFFPAMGVLALLTLLHFAVLFPLAEAVTPTQAPKKMRVVAVLLLLTGLCGNLFAILAGLIILNKSFNKDSEVSISWIDVFKRLFRSQVAVWGAFVIIFLITLTIFARYTFDYDLAVNNNYQAILQGPSLEYPLGTDDLGRCIFTRVVFGAKISLVAGLLSTMFSVVIGTTLGAIAGYYSGRIDDIIMRILDIFMAMPGLLLPIAIITAAGNSLTWIIIALGMGVIPGYGRTVRASVMTLTGCEFIEAERAIGAKDSWIILKHIIPNSMAPVIVRATMSFGGNVLAISSLSYLGVGIESYIPEWGNILQTGSTYLETASYMAIYPGIAIVLMVLGFNFLGDGFRDALDPKLK
ncbi:MAG: ABC transporter permease [Clostridiales bacterium]|nr:ABC transporter permease [Clostridiales bacterium]